MQHWLTSLFSGVPTIAIVIVSGVCFTAIAIVVAMLTHRRYLLEVQWRGGGLRLRPAADRPDRYDPPRLQ